MYHIEPSLGSAYRLPRYPFLAPIRGSAEDVIRAVCGIFPLACEIFKGFLLHICIRVRKAYAVFCLPRGAFLCENAIEIGGHMW